MFDNENRALFPNQFVNARLLQQEKTGVTLLPSAAIQRNTNNTYVYLIKPDNTVTVRNIKIGTTEGDQSEITSGLSPGDKVVMTGVDKLQEGSKVASRRHEPGVERCELTELKRMSPSRTFILRPVATSLLMVGILLAGIVAYRQLPVSALPEVDYPIIQIVTFYPGASPDVMASSVTAPLERQFGQVPGLQQMTSVSSDGSSVITLQFNLSLDIDVAEQEVQQSINASGTYLPADLPVPPVYSKTNPADAPVLTLALTSNDIPLSQVEDLADTRLAPKISQLPGRRPGQHQRRPEAGGPHPGESDAAGVLRAESGGSAHGAGRRQRQPGQGELRRSASVLSDRRKRSAAFERRLRRAGDRVQERRAGQADRRRHRQGQRREHAPGRVDESRCPP